MYKNIICFLLIVFFSLLISGCRTDIDQTVVDPLAPSVKFSASSMEVQAGEDVVLTWNVQNATHITISPGIGEVDSTGSTTVNPTATTDYILTASNDTDTSTFGLRITVLTNS